MERKIFDVFKQDNVSRIRVDQTVIALDDKEQRMLLKLFKNITTSEELFPAGLKGICLLYPDGLIAANISLSKISVVEDKYLLFLYYRVSNSIDYDCNTFLLTREALDKYTLALEEI